MVSRKHTIRADPSLITQHLCFTCGDVFTTLIDYQRHMLDHQVMSTIYQLYYLEHQYQNEDKETTASPIPALTGRRNTEPMKRPSIDVGRRPSADAGKRMNISSSLDEGERRYEESMKKSYRHRNVNIAQETVKKAEKTVRRSSFANNPPSPKKARLESRHKFKFSDSPGYLEMKSQEMYCANCPSSPSFKYPMDALQHWVDEHSATIERSDLSFFANNAMKYNRTNVTAGTKCPSCDLSFTESVGRLHLIERHLADVVEAVIKLNHLEYIDTIILNATVTLPNQKETTIRITANIVD